MPRPTYEFPYTEHGAVQSTWTCKPVEWQDVFAEDREQHPSVREYAPENWQWYRCTEQPCLSGDDMHIGFQGDHALFIWDGYATKVKTGDYSQEQVLQILTAGAEDWESKLPVAS